MRFQIKNRWTGAVQYECELPADFAVLSYGLQLGFAVKEAIAERGNLSDSDLSGCNLSDSDLTPIRDDLWSVLSSAPREVEGLRLALIEGRVDGSTYTGDCACLVGTIANLRGVSFENLEALKPNASRPIERFFMGINRGDTPKTSQVSKLALEWTDEWVSNVRAAFARSTT